MVVSHYVVSWIQLMGLAVGLYGFFFLSMTVLGSRSANYFRPLLPATAMALAVYIGLSIQGYLVSQHMYPKQPLLPVPSLPYWLWTTVGFIAGYVQANWVQKNFTKEDVTRVARRLTRKEITELSRWGVGGVVTILVLNTMLNVFVLHASLAGAALDQGIGLIVMGVYVVVFTAHLSLNESRLQKLGFIFSAVALLVQFIPPLLDVLNIAVK